MLFTHDDVVASAAVVSPNSHDARFIRGNGPSSAYNRASSCPLDGEAAVYDRNPSEEDSVSPAVAIDIATRGCLPGNKARSICRGRRREGTRRAGDRDKGKG